MNDIINENDFIVRHTEERGRCVHATRDFKKGTLLLEYAGMLYKDWEGRLLEEQYEEDPNIGNFMFFFTCNNVKYCIDAVEETRKLGRLINHGIADANVKPKAFMMTNSNGEQKPRLWLLASRDIYKGEELLYDYGDRRPKSIKNYPFLKPS